MKKTAGIYKITNTKTGQFYIGKSINIEQRWRGHKNHSRIFNWVLPIQYAMFEDGIDNFKFEILCELDNPTHDELKAKEKEYIKDLKPYYNNIKSPFKMITVPNEYVEEVKEKIRSHYKDQ